MLCSGAGAGSAGSRLDARIPARVLGAGRAWRRRRDPGCLQGGAGPDAVVLVDRGDQHVRRRLVRQGEAQPLAEDHELLGDAPLGREAGVRGDLDVHDVLVALLPDNVRDVLQADPPQRVRDSDEPQAHRPEVEVDLALRGLQLQVHAGRALLQLPPVEGDVGAVQELRHEREPDARRQGRGLAGRVLGPRGRGGLGLGLGLGPGKGERVKLARDRDRGAVVRVLRARRGAAVGVWSEHPWSQ
mmetsp:Transcript_90281/g.255890  ORF Transcript_90281/g.255890 Transcript_90281/m.255890 type:complete len:243 (+) Transcript_90281:60-788(+)